MSYTQHHARRVAWMHTLAILLRGGNFRINPDPNLGLRIYFYPEEKAMTTWQPSEPIVSDWIPHEATDDAAELAVHRFVATLPN